MTDVTLRPFEARDRDWLLDEHIRAYVATDAFDDSFGVLVGQILDDFLSTRDKEREAGWIAEHSGARLGSIFCTCLDETTAQLRLFFLVSEARGKGTGRMLLNTCMQFARSAGYTGMRLWTHDSHTAACRLYKASGWDCIERRPAKSFGQDMVIETYSYRF